MPWWPIFRCTALSCLALPCASQVKLRLKCNGQIALLQTHSTAPLAILRRQVRYLLRYALVAIPVCVCVCVCMCVCVCVQLHAHVQTHAHTRTIFFAPQASQWLGWTYNSVRITMKGKMIRTLEVRFGAARKESGKRKSWNQSQAKQRIGRSCVCARVCLCVCERGYHGAVGWCCLQSRSPFLDYCHGNLLGWDVFVFLQDTKLFKDVGITGGVTEVTITKVCDL